MIQFNDTHLTVMVAELLRILIDEEGLEFTEAYEIMTLVFSCMSHTLMPEALEKWSITLFEKVLQRHMQVIYELNQVFFDSVSVNCSSLNEVFSALSIIDEPSQKQLQMANLAVIGSYTVNGVT